LTAGARAPSPTPSGPLRRDRAPPGRAPRGRAPPSPRPGRGPQNSTYAPGSAALRCTAEMDRWVGDLSGYLKSLDPNHLVTVGTEGFYSALSPPGERPPRSRRAAPGPAPGPGPRRSPAPPPAEDVATNPREEDPPDCCPWNRHWAAKTGQDFSLNHAHPGVDYAALHLWVDNWGVPSVPFQEAFVRVSPGGAGGPRRPRRASAAEERGRVMRGPAPETRGRSSSLPHRGGTPSPPPSAEPDGGRPGARSAPGGGGIRQGAPGPPRAPRGARAPRDRRRHRRRAGPVLRLDALARRGVGRWRGAAAGGALLGAGRRRDQRRQRPRRAPGGLDLRPPRGARPGRRGGPPGAGPPEAPPPPPPEPPRRALPRRPPQGLRARAEAAGPVEGCVPGRDRSFEAVEAPGGRTFLSWGRHFAPCDGAPLGRAAAGDAAACAAACGGEPGCAGFAFAAGDGSCVALRGPLEVSRPFPPGEGGG